MEKKLSPQLGTEHRLWTAQSSEVWLVELWQPAQESTRGHNKGDGFSVFPTPPHHTLYAKYSEVTLCEFWLVTLRKSNW